MQKPSTRYTLVVLMLIMALAGVQCDRAGTNGDNDWNGMPFPREGLATNIKLYVYSNGWGTILDTLALATEGEITIDVPEQQPYSHPPRYYIYARADGFYTKLYQCEKGESIDVDLDAVPDHPNALTGVIFGRQSFFADCYFANKPITVSGMISPPISIRTDAEGRFGVGNLLAGKYTITLVAQGEPFSFTVANTAESNYEELSFFEPHQAMAPNIYLYPESESDLAVTVGFPAGGHLTESEPAYDHGWQVRVTPDGIIDGTYGYLFYEAMLTTPLNTTRGRVLDGRRLAGEFRDLLERYGFVGREIDDFLACWVPEFEGVPWLAVYPQDVESMITLDIEPEPDNVLRLLLLVQPLNHPVSLAAPPEPVGFDREGFNVVEWGVIGGGGDGGH